MVKESRYANLIVSIVGKCISNDGSSMMLETGDGQQVRIVHEGGEIRRSLYSTAPKTCLV